MTRRLRTCTAGGTGALEYLIVFALIGVVVAVGAHVYGEHTRGKFEGEAARVDDDVATSPAAPGGEARAAVATSETPVLATFDWRRVVDLLVAAPFVLMLLGGLRSWRRARRERLQAQRDRERAARLRAVVAARTPGGDSVLVDRDAVPTQKVAQMVAIHAGGPRRARDVAGVTVD